MLFLMHLAYTKYSFEFKATLAHFSHISLWQTAPGKFVRGSGDPALLFVFQLCWTQGHICIQGLRSRLTWALKSQKPSLWGATRILPSPPQIQALLREREDAQLAAIPSFAVGIPIPLQQQQGPPGGHHEESGPELSWVSEQSHPAAQGTASTAHRDTQGSGALLPQRGQDKQARGSLKGLLLEVVGRAENFLLSPGSALQPFSLLLSADVLQRCET